MADLAKAYVQIIPSAQGMQGQLESMMGGQADTAGESAGRRFSGKFGLALKAGGIAAAAGLTALTKSAVTAYADYEQLVGGVETLFSNLEGTVTAAPQVLAAAEGAYKTAGLSANEYMETVTSFSAALVSSLDGDYARAAEISDTAITDMADNANKMGTSMQSIQDAYQGFAKQNYTMLDNLKLGYGGTKTEMERLLADATALSGVEYNIDNLSDVYEAIHVVQTEIGITGTTAEEAEHTISGSLSMTKASWENLMVGVADGNANMSELMGNLVDSAGTLAENVVPVIGEALGSIGEAAPQIVQTLAGALVENLPTIIEGGVQLLVGLVLGLIQALPQLVAYVPTIISTLVTSLLGGVDQILGAGEQLLEAVCNGIGNRISEVFSKGAEIGSNAWNGIVSWFEQILAAGGELVAQVGAGISGAVDAVVAKGAEIVQSVKDGFMDMVDDALSWGSHLVQNIAQGIRNAIDWVTGAASSVASAIAGILHHTVPDEGPLADDDEWGGHLVQNLTKGMAAEESNLRRQSNRVAGIVRDSMDFDAGAPGFGLQARSYPADNSAFLTEIRNLGAAIRSMGVYLDSGVLIGTVNQGLGREKADQDRRALA